ncbi:MAG: glycosyltransferase family 4 protein [Candidatus Binatia bacterium]|nr:glycosyltransferase family 4 protein [Candidatus Binatia bacterium]
MRMHLRIGIDARVLAETAPLGVARYLTGLLRAAAQRAPQHEYLLYLRRALLSQGIFTAEPFRQRILSGNALLNNPWIWQQCCLPWSVWRDGVDVLFSPYYCGPLFLPVPQVVCLHDISFTLFPRDFPSWLRFKPKVLARPSSRVAARVVTVSEFSRQEIIRTYGVAPDKVVVVPPGSTDDLQGCGAAGGRMALLPQDGPFFLFVGSLLPRRRVDLVIRALALLPPEYRFVLVGEPDAAKYAPLKKIAQQCGVADRVQCVGYVSEPELDDLYRRAVAVVSPSTYEGFGLPVLEAMTRGVPVVAWDIPVMREVAGEAAMLVRSGDVAGLAQALFRIGTNRAEREALSEAGKQRAGQFSWHRSAASFLAVLQEAAATRTTDNPPS